MSDRLLRSRLESVYGARSVRRARKGPYAGAWVIQVYSSDPRQTTRDIASRFTDLGRVTSCNQFPSDDPKARRFQVVLVAPREVTNDIR